jgi:hypothetical protein
MLKVQIGFLKIFERENMKKNFLLCFCNAKPQTLKKFGKTGVCCVPLAWLHVCYLAAKPISIY